MYALVALQVPYPNSKQKRDLVIGEPPELCIELNMARVYGNNNKPDDTGVKEISRRSPSIGVTVSKCGSPILPA